MTVTREQLDREADRRVAAGGTRKLENPEIAARVAALLRQSGAWGAKAS